MALDIFLAARQCDEWLQRFGIEPPERPRRRFWRPPSWLSAIAWHAANTSGSINAVSFVEQLDRLDGGGRSRAEKMWEALAMYEEGLTLQRQTLRRRHPNLSPEELDRRLAAWLLREDSA